MSEGWTPDRIAELRRRWDAGDSSTKIGAALGISKNSVLSKIHRIGMPLRPSPIRPRAGAETQKEQRTARASVPSLADLLPAPARAEFATPSLVAATPPTIAASPSSATATCQWPSGDPRNPDFRFCGTPIASGRVYCAEHHARAYTPIQHLARLR